MADNKKEQERAELHRTIWGIANDLPPLSRKLRERSDDE
jgi:hypothetical protein